MNNHPASVRVERPRPVDRAHWQAGVTPGNARLRPFIDGEPAPLCFAVNIREGWADLYIAGGPHGVISRERTRRVFGHIELRRCNGEDE